MPLLKRTWTFKHTGKSFHSRSITCKNIRTKNCLPEVQVTPILEYHIELSVFGFICTSINSSFFLAKIPFKNSPISQQHVVNNNIFAVVLNITHGSCTDREFFNAIGTLSGHLLISGNMLSSAGDIILTSITI